MMLTYRGYGNASAFRKTTNKLRSLCGAKRLGLLIKRAYWYAYIGGNSHAGEKMPWDIILIMVCDLIALDMLSSEEELTPKKHIKWWYERRETLGLNPDTLWVIDVIFQRMIRGKFEGVLSDKTMLDNLRKTYES